MPRRRAVRLDQRACPAAVRIRPRRDPIAPRLPLHPAPNMNRRTIISTFSGAAIVRPLSGFAQQAGKLARIGIIDNAPIWDHFRSRLRELGDIEGQTITIDYRTAEGNPDRLLTAAKELAALSVNAIAVYGSPAAKAAQAATARVPIVAISIGDPVRIGLVQSLAHPGGNITGNTILGPDLVPKRLQLLKEALPQARRVAFLWYLNNESNRALYEELQAAALKIAFV